MLDLPSVGWIGTDTGECGMCGATACTCPTAYEYVYNEYNAGMSGYISDDLQSDTVWRLDCYQCSAVQLHDMIRTRMDDPRIMRTTGWDLSGNELSVLPDIIGNFTHLNKLYLFNNLLTALPYSIGSLVNLTGLYLFNNLLTALPDNIGNLTELTKLDVSNNPLQDQLQHGDPATISPTGAPTTETTYAVLNAGHDCPGGDISVTDTTSGLAECGSLCDANGQCKGVSYQASDGRCILKNFATCSSPLSGNGHVFYAPSSVLGGLCTQSPSPQEQAYRLYPINNPMHMHAHATFPEVSE